MLLPIDMNPENSLYYYGAMIIQELNNEENLDIVSLYSRLKNKIKISLISYSLTLDWLYMIDCVNVNETGGVKLCISKD